jgi:hypothetical protein
MNRNVIPTYLVVFSEGMIANTRRACIQPPNRSLSSLALTRLESISTSVALWPGSLRGPTATYMRDQRYNKKNEKDEKQNFGNSS